MTLEELEAKERLHEELKQDRAQYVKFDHDQLLAIMTAIVISGRCFSDPTTALVGRSARLAYDVYERIIRHQEYTEYDEELE